MATLVYAGIEPTVRQSGEFCSTRNHMPKRGSPYLRHAIFLAASCCSFHGNPLNDYYRKKRDQGKHHLSAVGAVSNKLTTIIYAVLRDSKPYEPIKDESLSCDGIKHTQLYLPSKNSLYAQNASSALFSSK